MTQFLESRRQVLSRSLLLLAIILPIGFLFFARFSFAIEIQTKVRSMPYSFYVIDRSDRAFARNDLLTFKAARMVAPFHDGQQVVKFAIGLPGDHVVVTPESVWVNGVKVRDNQFKVLGEDRGTPQPIVPRDEIVPPGHYFVLGGLPRSYDSRFWGYVEPERVVGKAHPLL